MRELAHAILRRSLTNRRSLAPSLWTLVAILSVGICSGSSLAHAQQDRQQDQQQQDQSQSNPSRPSQPQEPAEKTDEASSTAGKPLPQKTLIKLRDLEVGWLTGPFVGKEGQVTPLTGDERLHIYLQETLTTPGAYLKRMVTAGFDQAFGTPRQWDDGWGGYAERFASEEGQFIISNSVAASGNAMLGYEVRYDQCRCTGFWPRTHHAIVRNFVTYNRTERERRPQWALYAGQFAGGAISSTWKPGPRNAFAEGGLAMASQAGWGTLLNFAIEFADDFNRKLGAKKRHTRGSALR
jgi:hypothetical protein